MAVLSVLRVALALICLQGIVSCTVQGAQVPLQAHSPAPHTASTEITASLDEWNAPPKANATGNLIFNAVYSLLQRWPNTLYRNGHSIVPASIPAGTVMYRGSTGSAVPEHPEWLALNPEHSTNFARPYLLTFVTTRALRLAYFDGSSAAQMRNGTYDTQEVLLWGKPNATTNYDTDDVKRLDALCEWGKKFPVPIDGFIRMEYDFEVMYCNLTSGLQFLSSTPLLPQNCTPVSWPPQSEPPAGWIGTPPAWREVYREAFFVGQRHDRAPGESRAQIDYTGFVSFFDTELKSLVETRATQTRLRYRLLGISDADVKTVRDELAEVFARSPVHERKKWSGIDWGNVVSAIVLRYAERLELLQHVLDPESFTSDSPAQRAARVRRELLFAWMPYLSPGFGIPNSPYERAANSSAPPEWIGSMAETCAATYTGHLPTDKLTKQEQRILRAVEETLKEICRVLALMWADAFAIEDVSVADDVRRGVLESWRARLKGLMEWLDWSAWVKCKPACEIGSICYIPTWRWRAGENATDLTPRCVPRIPPLGADIPDPKNCLVKYH